MSSDDQQSAIAANADVMNELTGSDVNNVEAAKRQNSVEQASVIAQAGDTAPSGSNSKPANTDQKQASTETPAVRPTAASGAASPVKPAPGSPVVASSALQGHARQDLTEKLDDLAPDALQSGGETAGVAQEPSAAAPTAQTEGKENSSAETKGRSAAPVWRKTEEELPEGIRALRNKFTATPSSSNSGLPQPVPLPKDTPSSASPLTLEVQHKPGSKKFSYKELRELRLEDGIDPTCKEEYLTDDEFTEVFQKWSPDRAQFKQQPKWRQRMQKQAVGLF